MLIDQSNESHHYNDPKIITWPLLLQKILKFHEKPRVLYAAFCCGVESCVFKTYIIGSLIRLNFLSNVMCMHMYVILRHNNGDSVFTR